MSGKELDLSFFSKRRFFLKEWQFVDRELNLSFAKDFISQRVADKRQLTRE